MHAHFWKLPLDYGEPSPDALLVKSNLGIAVKKNIGEGGES